MKNWKTSIAGLVGAVAVAITDCVQNGHSLLEWKVWIIPAALAALGFLSKDHSADAPKQ